MVPTAQARVRIGGRQILESASRTPQPAASTARSPRLAASSQHWPSLVARPLRCTGRRRGVSSAQSDSGPSVCACCCRFCSSARRQKTYLLVPGVNLADDHGLSAPPNNLAAGTALLEGRGNLDTTLRAGHGSGGGGGTGMGMGMGVGHRRSGARGRTERLAHAAHGRAERVHAARGKRSRKHSRRGGTRQDGPHERAERGAQHREDRVEVVVGPFPLRPWRGVAWRGGCWREESGAGGG